MLIEISDIDLKMIKMTDRDVFNMITNAKLPQTMNVIYEQHSLFYIALSDKFDPWKSKKKYDGTEIKGSFILGCNISGKSIYYIINNKYWNLSKARELDIGVVTTENASNDITQTLINYLKS